MVELSPGDLASPRASLSAYLREIFDISHPLPSDRIATIGIVMFSWFIIRILLIDISSIILYPCCFGSNALSKCAPIAQRSS